MILFMKVKVKTIRTPASHPRIWIVAGKDERNLQTPAESLVVQKSRLECGYEGKPRTDCYWNKNNHPHGSIV
jgi:hypothetical protein